MAETKNAVPCMNFNPSVVCLKDIVGEEDTHSGETTPGHYSDKWVKELLSALDLEDSDKDCVEEEEDTDSEETKPVHDHDKCIKGQQAPLYMDDSDEDIVGEHMPGHDLDKCINEQLAALNMDDSDKEITSEDEMDSRGMMCLCGQNHCNYAEDLYQIERQKLREKYSISEPKPEPLTSEELDVLSTKKLKEWCDRVLQEWYSKKEVSRYG